MVSICVWLCIVVINSLCIYHLLIETFFVCMYVYNTLVVAGVYIQPM